MSAQLAVMEHTALSSSCPALHSLRRRKHVALRHAPPGRSRCQHSAQPRCATFVARASVGSTDIENSVADAIHSTPDRPDAQLAADAAVAAQPDATTGERARLLVRNPVFCALSALCTAGDDAFAVARDAVAGA